MLDYDVFENTRVFSQDKPNKTKPKKLLQRLSISIPSSAVSKKRQLKEIENETRKLEDEIEKFNGNRKDRRYSEIQSKLISNSFQAENFRKSFKRKKDIEELKNFQANLSLCMKKMEQKVDRNEFNTNQTSEGKNYNIDNSQFQKIEQQIGILKEQIRNSEHFNEVEEAVLKISADLENLSTKNDPGCSERKRKLETTLQNLKTKIANRKYAALQQAINHITVDNTSKFDRDEMNQLFQTYVITRDKFRELEFQIFKFIKNNNRTNERKQHVRSEEFYRLLEELKVINLQMEQVKLAFENL